MFFLASTDEGEGEGTEIHVAKRQQDVIDDLILRLRDSGWTVFAISQVLNRSPRYVYRRLEIVRERADVPGARDSIPVLGIDPYWGPDVEMRVASRPCRRCGGDVGPVEPGSPFVCLACMHSGIDDRLEAELAAERARERAAEDARAAERRRRGVTARTLRPPRP